MRHQCTPIFSDVLASRIWAMAPSTRVVWLWFQLKADPDGFVCCSTAGVAIGANVTLEAAALALEELTEIDTDTEPTRVLEKVPRGWRLVGLEERLQEAKQERMLEAQRERNRIYMRTYRGKRPANDSAITESPPDLTPLGPTEVLQTSTLPSTLPPKASTEHPLEPTPASRAPVGSGSGSDQINTNNNNGSPLPPVVVVIEPYRYEDLGSLSPELLAATRPVEGPSVTVVAPRVVHALGDFEPSDELRQEALVAGVTEFDKHLARLKTGPIGGARGVFASQLEDYVRQQFGNWRTWEETDRAKATAAKARGQSYRAPTVSIEPTTKHRAYAKKHNLPLDELVRELHTSGAVDDLGAKRALEMLGEKMGRLVREQCDRLIAAGREVA